MSIASTTFCGVCEQPLAKATRVYQGVRYCSTCYARCFKRMLCGGCGVFQRLLAATPDALCVTCEVKQPCVRCGKTGRPVGKLTPYGPACNICRVYFVEERACESCGLLARGLTRPGGAHGDKAVCHRCARDTYRTCMTCRKYRECTADDYGKWRCSKCTLQPNVVCNTCGSAMPAGAGSRCGNCYWLERCSRHTRQLSELLHSALTRQAFEDYGQWLIQKVDPKRAALNLQRHCEFFVKLDGTGPAQWTSALLLEVFGTSGLRKLETPVRWLKSQREGLLTEEEKCHSAELRRVHALVALVPSGSEARSVIEDFAATLLRRLDKGEIKARSVRMALRPAIDLLLTADSGGRRLVDQNAVDRYLTVNPGQRAALSTFIGFMRSSRVINLTLPRAQTKALRSPSDLEKKLAALVAEGPGAHDFRERWVRTALAYFHRLTISQARRLLNSSKLEEKADGFVINTGSHEYWIPSHFARFAQSVQPRNQPVYAANQLT